MEKMYNTLAMSASVIAAIIGAVTSAILWMTGRKVSAIGNFITGFAGIVGFTIAKMTAKKKGLKFSAFRGYY